MDMWMVNGSFGPYGDDTKFKKESDVKANGYNVYRIVQCVNYMVTRN